MVDCEGCGKPITPEDTTVYADEGAYHFGCEFEEIDEQVSSSN